MAYVWTEHHVVEVTLLQGELWAIEIWREDALVFRACVTSETGKEARAVANKELTRLEVLVAQEDDTIN